jgi:hypothetical protein
VPQTAKQCPTIKARAVPLVQVDKREDGTPEMRYLDTVDGVGISARTREGIEDCRKGVLLGQAHAQEQMRTAVGPIMELLGPTSPAPAPNAGINADADSQPKPRWDRHARQLWLGPDMVRTYRRHATKQFLVLDAFEKAGWPTSINAPSGCLSPKDTVEALNDGLITSRLRFGWGTAGGVDRIRWTLTV